MTLNKIKILPEALANKIAAGEVVERPASVIKELVENAIDASATKIIIVIRNAGKSLIQVTDNGVGMSEDDALMAFERHATSKISDFKDIEQLHTMGFRGEALPSIAAVSQVELITRQQNEALAHKIKLEGGVIQDVSKTAAEVGTSIHIKNLFFNVPARKNFMKTNATEFNHILGMLKRFFLAHPTIHFELFQENDKIFDLPSGSIEKRIIDVLGDGFFSGLLEINEQLGDIHLNGYVLKPDLARFSRGQQFLFINNRLIDSKYVHHAISSAYGHKIEKNQFAGYCLYLKIDPTMIDINVHPTKMDVRFSNDRMIYNLFQASVQRALNVDEVVPEIEERTFQDVAAEQRSAAQMNSVQNNNVVQFEDLEYRPKQSFGQGNKKSQAFVPNQARLTFTYKDKESIVDDRLDPSLLDATTQPKRENEDEYQALWQIHNRYILSQIKSGLVIIDQHVAHERILYEKILTTLRSGSQFHSQQLLFPQTVELSKEDYQFFLELSEKLTTVGYSVKPFGGTTIVIDAIPGDIKIGNEVQSLLDILDYHRENITVKRDPAEQMAAAYSCRNAIKSGEKLCHREMQALVDQLFATSTPYFCPHGRPIIVTISLQELDKKFKRI